MRNASWVVLFVILSACQVSFQSEFNTSDPTAFRQPTHTPEPSLEPERLTRTPWPTQPPRETVALANIDAITAIENHTMQLYAQYAPSVVAIEAAFTHPPIEGVDIPGEMFVSQGSGFVYDDQGHIVTNAHVVSDANTYRIRLDEQRVVSATVIGRDSTYDIAVLQLDEYIDIAPLTLSQRTAQPGMWVMAIGNPFGLRDSVSVGIVSGVGRELAGQYGSMNDIIQVDAAVNPGSSGGVILDRNGEVLGMVTAIQSGNGNFSGIGYAIPAQVLSTVVAQLIR
ncbi:MAG: S1C family serine protease [Chloroflexota bacterium]|jgi:2-alkenal reductase